MSEYIHKILPIITHIIFFIIGFIYVKKLFYWIDDKINLRRIRKRVEYYRLLEKEQTANDVAAKPPPRTAMLNLQPMFIICSRL
jgi:hypothetical protein